MSSITSKPVSSSSEPPDLSVVISVYNGEDRLEASLRSVLKQQGPSFEVILINDGSGPQATAILRAFAAQDRRVCLIEQDNTGLTQALIRGCAAAKASIIVRQDADDISLPGRFAALARAFREHPDAVLVATWAELRGPADEPLHVVTRPADPVAWRHGLLHERQGPPAHGATAFRREAYDQVGGYRAEFYYAQDNDLWLRLAEVGGIVCVPEVRYAYMFRPEGISGARLTHQRAFGELAVACHHARMAGKDDRPLLAQAASIRTAPMPRAKHARAHAFYFIGACLARRHDRRCLPYLWSAWLRVPWHARYLARALLGLATLAMKPRPFRPISPAGVSD